MRCFGEGVAGYWDNLWQQQTSVANSALVYFSVFVALFVVCHILLFKSNSRSAILWVLLVLAFPLTGAALYWVFGINRVWRETGRAQTLTWSDQSVLPPLADDSALQHSRLHGVGARVSGNVLRTGSSIEPLVNGEQAFPAMLDAISHAQSEILLASFIFDHDTTGLEFVVALAAARDRGVRVSVLLDDVGRRYSVPTVRRLLCAHKIEHQFFMPLRMLPPNLSINLRNHRKLLLVDQHVAFVGGMNIGDRQLAEGDSRLKTSDLHFRALGPWLPIYGMCLLPTGRPVVETRCRLLCPTILTTKLVLSPPG